MFKNIETSNLYKQKNKETTWFQNQIIILQVFHKKIIGYRNEKKTQILLNKPVYLGLSTLDLSQTLMYEFWYDYVKTKYGEKAKLCYMDTDSFIIHIKKNKLKILQKMLKQDLIFQIIVWKGHYQKKRTKTL